MAEQVFALEFVAKLMNTGANCFVQKGIDAGVTNRQLFLNGKKVLLDQKRWRKPKFDWMSRDRQIQRTDTVFDST